MDAGKHEWEYSPIIDAIKGWAGSWLCGETQNAYTVGPTEIQASAAEAIADAAVHLGWWQDIDGGWHKPIVPGRD